MDNQIENLAVDFREFGEIHVRDMSPLYAHLSVEISSDTDLLEIASKSSPGQPAPNLLFASVRYLLDRDECPDLLAKYPTNFGTKFDPGAFDQFREFVLARRDRIGEMLSNKRVQSNVVRRSAILLAGLMQISGEFGSGPFVNYEIGASAGLTLLWQKYSYRYGDGPLYGDLDSSVLVQTELRGAVPFDYSFQMPNVTENIGIELDHVDQSDEAASDWLRALIFPEHADNRELFDAAVNVSKETPPNVTEGDALKLLPEMLDQLTPGNPANIYHSHTLNQFSVEMREQLDLLLRHASKKRRVTRLGFEGTPHGHSDLRLTRYLNGAQEDTVVLANCEAHGRWIEWVG